MAIGDWRLVNGEQRMAIGERLNGSEWRVASGEW